jgi:integrase
VKDDEARVVPILPPLAPVLAEWKLATGGKGLLFPPLVAKRGGRPDAPPRFVKEHTLGKRLRAVLDKLKLNRSGLNWYRCTRHTFASQWVIGGGSIEKLAAILGHADITTTQRYAHLRTDHFREADLRAVAVDLSRPTGTVVELAPSRAPGDVGRGMGAGLEGHAKKAK